jgi:hypothetical protein
MKIMFRPRPEESGELEQVPNYYLNANHLSIYIHEMYKQIIILSVAISRAELYSVIADNYANRIKGLYRNDAFASIHYILGNCL